MRIKQSACQQNFKGIYNNKAILKGLELASDYSATFVATSSFLGAVALRPLAISLTPNADKENKKVISAESIASAISKLVVAEAMILPVENAIKKINQDPTEYLSEDTIKNLANNSKELVNSKNYNFLAQIIKFSSNIFASIPKTVLSVALIPILVDFLFSRKEEKNKNKDLSENYLIKRTIDNNQNFVNFRGFILDVYIATFIITSFVVLYFSRKKNYSFMKVIYIIVNSLLFLPVSALLVYNFVILGSLMSSFYLLVVFSVVIFVINQLTTKIDKLYDIAVGNNEIKEKGGKKICKEK